MTDIIEATTAVSEVTAIENGAVLLVPLNKLKKSPRNARKTPHCVSAWKIDPVVRGIGV